MQTTTYLTVATGVLSLNVGWWTYLQRLAKKDLIDSAARWLTGSYSQTSANEWRDHLVLTFDKTFGIEPFSKMFLVKSLKVTVVTTVVIFSSLLAIAFYVSPLPASKIVDALLANEDRWGAVEILGGMFGAFVYNAIPDFLSLCETRMVLSYLHRVVGPKRLIGYLLIDLILSTGIFAFWFLCVFGTSFSIFPGEKHGAPMPTFLMLSLAFGALLGVISNYLSSGWIWFYGIAGVANRGIDALLRGRLTNFSSKYLNLAEKPFDYLAMLTSLILALFLLGLYLLLVGTNMIQSAP